MTNYAYDYIGYIDSDDYVPENYYESLMDTIITNKADIAVCDIKSVYEKSGQILRSQCGTTENEKIDFCSFICSTDLCCYHDHQGTDTYHGLYPSR